LKKTVFNIFLSACIAFIASVLIAFISKLEYFSFLVAYIFLILSFLIFITLLIQNRYVEQKSNLLRKFKENENEIIALKDAAEYRKEYIGDVSHELKTPIFNMQGYVLTLLDGGIHDKEINVKYLKRTEKNINRLISIVEDLGTISKIEAKELKLNINKIDLVQLAIEVFEMLEVKALKANIQIIITSEKASHYARADRDRITEVLSNLVTNAVRYGKENGFVKIKIKESHNQIVTLVEDDGIGISEPHLNRIFERFYRVDKSRSAKLGGTGLGLAIVKHIVEAHNQTIVVKSTEGQGSKFTFTLDKG